MACNCNSRCATCVNQSGIPVLKTIAVTTDTTGSAVIYDIDRCRFNSLPNEGLMILRIAQAPASGSDAFLVSISTCRTLSGTGVISTSGSPLLNGILEQMPSSQVVNGSNLLIYYNRCNNFFQVVNNMTPATASGTTTFTTSTRTE